MTTLNDDKTKKLATILLLFAFGFLMLFMREPGALLTPRVYAEDGIWTAAALRDGWIHTFYHARTDYYVFFNIALLFIASKISYLVSASPLVFLPQAIAIVSYSFYSIASVLIYKTLRIYSNIFFAMSGFLFSILIPLGLSTSESIGTLVQVGFYMPIISICLHLLRTEYSKKWSRYIFDIFIFLAAATNPVCFAVTGIYFILQITKAVNEKNVKNVLLDLLPIISSLAFLFLIIVPNLNGQGGIPISPNPDNVIEMVTARSVVYSFIFPWYSNLNDYLSILLTLLFASMCIAAYINTGNMRVRQAIALLSSMLIVYTIATAMGRYGITGILSGYKITYPDRYFMGINVIASTLFIIVISQLSKMYFMKYISYAFTIMILAFHITDAVNKTSLNYASLKYDAVGEFNRNLCNSEITPDGFALIQIQPVPDWKMKVPHKYISNIDCSTKN